MYETLIMLKAEAQFSVNELHALVTDVLMGTDASVTVEGSGVYIALGGSSLGIAWNSEGYVAQESGEIADHFGIPCRGCRARFEMTGEDPEMELFNDYLRINQQLQATGNFVIFDTQQCKLLFE